MPSASLRPSASQVVERRAGAPSTRVARLVLLPWLFVALPGCVVTVENDFVGRDANYTSGLRAERRVQPADDDWLARVTRGMAGGLDFFEQPAAGEHRVTRFGLAVGQQLYTPEDIELEPLQVDDRPYAGWLYTSLVRHDAFHDELPGRRHDRLVTTSVDLGVVGQGAGGERTQKAWHEIVHDDDPKGWGNQLENEAGLLVSLLGQWRLHYEPPESPRDLGWDVIGQAGGNLGNVRSSASVGGLLRVGLNLPRAFDVGLPEHVDPDCGCGEHDAGPALYGFVGGDAELVLRDIFLDGNTFTSSHSVDREPLVGTLRFGAAARYGAWSLRWAHIMRSDQFEGQNHHHAYSSIVLAWSPARSDPGAGAP